MTRGVVGPLLDSQGRRRRESEQAGKERQRQRQQSVLEVSATSVRASAQQLQQLLLNLHPADRIAAEEITDETLGENLDESIYSAFFVLLTFPPETIGRDAIISVLGIGMCITLQMLFLALLYAAVGQQMNDPSFTYAESGDPAHDDTDINWKLPTARVVAIVTVAWYVACDQINASRMCIFSRAAFSNLLKPHQHLRSASDRAHRNSTASHESDHSDVTDLASDIGDAAEVAAMGTFKVFVNMALVALPLVQTGVAAAVLYMTMLSLNNSDSFKEVIIDSVSVTFISDIDEFVQRVLVNIRKRILTRFQLAPDALNKVAPDPETGRAISVRQSMNNLGSQAQAMQRAGKNARKAAGRVAGMLTKVGGAMANVFIGEDQNTARPSTSGAAAGRPQSAQRPQSEQGPKPRPQSASGQQPLEAHRSLPGPLDSVREQGEAATGSVAVDVEAGVSMFPEGQANGGEAGHSREGETSGVADLDKQGRRRAEDAQEEPSTTDNVLTTIGQVLWRCSHIFYVLAPQAVFGYTVFNMRGALAYKEATTMGAVLYSVSALMMMISHF